MYLNFVKYVNGSNYSDIISLLNNLARHLCLLFLFTLCVFDCPTHKDHLNLSILKYSDIYRTHSHKALLYQIIHPSACFHYRSIGRFPPSAQISQQLMKIVLPLKCTLWSL